MNFMQNMSPLAKISTEIKILPKHHAQIQKKSFIIKLSWVSNNERFPSKSK